MKTIVVMVIFAVLATSCMKEVCATYGDKKRSTSNVLSGRVSAKKDRTPYYKTIKLAEQD